MKMTTKPETKNETVRNVFAPGKYFGTKLLCVWVLFNTTSTLLARHTRTKYDYNINVMLLMSESMKFVASIVLEAITYVKAEDNNNSTFKLIESRDYRSTVSNWISALLESFRVNIWENPRDALKLTVPSGLYLVQNSLVYYSISLVPIPLFQITQQTKLVMTAFLSVLFLKRTYIRAQWYSIFSLCIGATICILSHSSTAAKEYSGVVEDGSAATHLLGVVLVLFSNLSNSIACVYFEIVVKGKEESTTKKVLPSIWMRNVQLAFFAICIICTKLYSEQRREPFFYDFTPLLWVQISIFAFGGLVVASVIKHTDSVQKGLGAGLSLILSSALSMAIEGGDMKISFVFGAVLVIGGCFFFANPDADINTTVCASSSNQIISMKKIYGHMIAFILLATYCLYSTKLTHDLMGTVRHNLSDEPDFKLRSVPGDWKDHLHVHVYQATHNISDTRCGGCMVLWELASSVSDLGIATSTSYKCPDINQTELVKAAEANKTIVIVHPEVITDTCAVPGNSVVFARWILAPLSPHNDDSKTYFFREWNEDDMVFNFDSSCAIRPDLLPSSNILQVITSQTEGDEFDVPATIFSDTNHTGRKVSTACAKRFARDCYRYGKGDRVFEAGMLVHDAYTK